MSDLKNRILESDDLRVKEIEIEEWEGTFLLQEPNAMQIKRDLKKYEKKDQGLGALVAWCLRDMEGNRIFTDADIPEIMKKSFRVLSKIDKAIVEYFELDKDVDEFEGNFEETETD